MFRYVYDTLHTLFSKSKPNVWNELGDKWRKDRQEQRDATIAAYRSVEGAIKSIGEPFTVNFIEGKGLNDHQLSVSADHDNIDSIFALHNTLKNDFGVDCEVYQNDEYTKLIMKNPVKNMFNSLKEKFLENLNIFSVIQKSQGHKLFHNGYVERTQEELESLLNAKDFSKKKLEKHNKDEFKPVKFVPIKLSGYKIDEEKSILEERIKKEKSPLEEKKDLAHNYEPRALSKEEQEKTKAKVWGRKEWSEFLKKAREEGDKLDEAENKEPTTLRRSKK